VSRVPFSSTDLAIPLCVTRHSGPVCRSFLPSRQEGRAESIVSGQRTCDEATPASDRRPGRHVLVPPGGHPSHPSEALRRVSPNSSFIRSAPPWRQGTMTSERNSIPTLGRFDSTEPSPDADSPPSFFRAASQAGFAPDGQNFANIQAPPGATVFPPGAPTSAATNPRSCVTCRRRKVRCDKHMPCGNCRRAQISCIFPAPGRAPRRPRPKDPNAPPKQHSSEREIELVKRLRKLEGIVEELSGQIELEAVRHPSSDGHSPEATGDGDRRMPSRTESQGAASQQRPSPAASSGSRKESSGAGAQPGSGQGSSPFGGGLVRSPTELNKNFGRLVLSNKGTSRYVSSGFWSKINDEVSLEIVPNSPHGVTLH
jgi:hypothetical protein